MSREDSSRARELEQQVSNDLAELAKLRASTSGLQKQVVAVQAKIDAAGELGKLNCHTLLQYRSLNKLRLCEASCTS